VRCPDPRCEIQSTGEREREPEDATSPVRDTARQEHDKEPAQNVSRVYRISGAFSSVNSHVRQISSSANWREKVVTRGKKILCDAVTQLNKEPASERLTGLQESLVPSVGFRYRRVKGHRLQRLHHPACATIAFSASPPLLLHAHAKS